MDEIHITVEHVVDGRVVARSMRSIEPAGFHLVDAIVEDAVEAHAATARRIAQMDAEFGPIPPRLSLAE